MTYDARAEGDKLARDTVCDCQVDGDPSVFGGHQQWCRGSERWERDTERCTAALQCAYDAGLAEAEEIARAQDDGDSAAGRRTRSIVNAIAAARARVPGEGP